MRVVLDTNVLIDSARDDFSAPYQLLEAAQRGELEVLVTPAVLREYRHLVLQRVTQPRVVRHIQNTLAHCRMVTGQATDITLDDPADIKFIQAAMGGAADYIVTSDHHLLTLGEVDTIRIITPEECLRILNNNARGSSEWHDLIKSFGLGGH
jgi:putative PIN family toxin of toxin-antitoxin system